MSVPTIYSYVWWHYTVALPQIFAVWRDLTWYVGHLFSIGLLLRTILSPWKRMTEEFSGGGAEAFFEVIALNLMSRLVGLVIRVPIICIGAAALCLMVVGLGVFYAVWLLAPVLIVLGGVQASYLVVL